MKNDIELSHCFFAVSYTESGSMAMSYVWKIDQGSKKVQLKDYDPGFTAMHTDRNSADQELQALSNELNELQELLAAAQKNSLLVVLQGMDTSGKDGTIRH